MTSARTAARFWRWSFASPCARKTRDLRDPEPDDLADDVVRRQLRGREPDRPLREAEAGEPVAERVDRRRAEREDAEVLLRHAEPEQRAVVELQRSHPVARSLLRARR